MFGRNDTSRVTGMNTGKLNMFHNRRNKCMRTVTDRIRLTLSCMIEETVNKDRSVRCHTDSGLHISDHAFCVIDNFHTTSAKNIRRTNHNRISDLLSDFQSIFNSNSHTGFRHRNFKFIHHGTEQISVFCQINNSRWCTENLHTVGFKSPGKV